MGTQTKRQGKGPRPLPRPFDARVLFSLFDEGTDDSLIGDALGVGRVQVSKWRRGHSFMLTEYHADRIAIRIGTHPAMLWGRQWWESVTEQ